MTEVITESGLSATHRLYIKAPIMRVIFMGTPVFAVPALQRLIDSNHQVVAVFSQAPKPQGRGMQLKCSPVHELATRHRIPVYTPKTLRSAESFALLESIEAEAIAVVAYGFIVPVNVLDIKRYGCINIHPSALPKYRGPSPLPYIIINGEENSAVCTMRMDAGVDTGDILLRRDFALDPNIDLSTLHDITARMGADLLLETLDNIDHLPRIRQSTEGAVYVPKLTKEDSQIDWNLPAYIISRRVRALNPWPGVHFTKDGDQIKVLAAQYHLAPQKALPGTVLSSEELAIACGTGTLYPTVLQRPGKKAMNVQSFLQGYTIKPGTILT